MSDILENVLIRRSEYSEGMGIVSQLLSLGVWECVLELKVLLNPKPSNTLQRGCLTLILLKEFPVVAQALLLSMY